MAKKKSKSNNISINIACPDKNSKSKVKCFSCRKSTSGGYFLGFIGAAVYFMTKATTFGGVIIGLLKAMVWPAFLVYGLLKFLGL